MKIFDSDKAKTVYDEDQTTDYYLSSSFSVDEENKIARIYITNNIKKYAIQAYLLTQSESGISNFVEFRGNRLGLGFVNDWVGEMTIENKGQYAFILPKRWGNIFESVKVEIEVV